MRYPPCKGCPRREVGCHAKCEDYKSWKAEWDEMQKVIRAQQRATQQFIDDMYRNTRKTRYNKFRRR